MATLNGHFDLARALFERGADITLASDAGATPLYGVLNTQWIPKSRHPQPTDHTQQQTTYLDLMELLLEAGADPNVRLHKTLWYTEFGRSFLSVDRMGATPFWRAAFALDVPAMRLLVAHGADPHIPTVNAPRRFRRGGRADMSGLAPVPIGGPGSWPIHAASGITYGEGFAANVHRHVPEAWVPAVRYLVEELGSDVNAPRPQRLHRRAPRRRPRRQRAHPLPGEPGCRRYRREPERPDHRRHGQRSGPAHPSPSPKRSSCSSRSGPTTTTTA